MTESNETEWLKVCLPKGLVEKVEWLRNQRLERRPGNVPLGLYVADLLKETLEREEDKLASDQLLEIYLVEAEKVFIKDSRTDKVVELDIDSSRELFCKEDSSRNCVHIGFAWGSHSVRKKISPKKA